MNHGVTIDDQIKDLESKLTGSIIDDAPIRERIAELKKGGKIERCVDEEHCEYCSS